MRSVFFLVLLTFSLRVKGQLLLDILEGFTSPRQFAGSNLRKSYDFIVVGAGSGGCVVANRLSENGKWSVLLLEAGRDESFLTDIPLVAAMYTSTSYNWGYKSEHSKNSCLGLVDSRCNLPRGKAVGGTSVINFLIYTRGNALDFDEWASLGNHNWSYEDVLPYFKKSENCSNCENLDDIYHGHSGELHIEHVPYKTPLVERFIRAGRELGYKNTDHNGRTHLGFSEVQATMRGGMRYSAARAFLNESVKRRENLHIVTRARVTKILVDPETKTANGVKFLKNKQELVVKVKKEIILCAGSLNSPQLLMLSGIGPKDHLDELGIPVIKDLKVGYNLQDHVSLTSLIFLINQSVTISDTSVQNPVDVLNYFANGDGPFTVPSGAEALAFLKTPLTLNTSNDYPDIEIVLGAGAVNGDSYGFMRKLSGIPDSFFEKVCSMITHVPSFSMSVVLMRPRSKGRVKLKDANPLHWPVIETNYFHDEHDVEVMVEGIKKTLLIANTKSFQELNTSLHDIPYPGCETFSFASDEYWKCVVHQMATTLGHQVGTCKMGPKNDVDAVVDPELKVHGIVGLRIVDASIMPSIVAGHTNSVVIMIGERAADFIKKTWD